MKKIYTLLWLLLLSGQLLAQSKGMIPVGKQLPAGTERRLALVIGNKNYAYASRLSNTHNDADDMAKVLQNLGFDVLIRKDLSYVDMLKLIDDFGDKLSGYDVGLLYYSGHGLQYQGENYLVPIDANAKSAREIAYTCVSLGKIMGKMEDARLKVSLAFLDACRNNPFPSSNKSIGQGLTIPNNPPGSFVAFSTRAGSTADDNSDGRNGLFTTALLQNLRQANVSLRTMMDNTIKQVSGQSNKAQIPGRYDELTGDFYFLVSSSGVTPKSEPVKSKTDLLPYEPEMVFVQGGSFEMGSNDYKDDGARPVHRVTLDDYYIGKYEITVGEFRRFVEATGYLTEAEKGGGSYVWTGSIWEKRSGVNWRYDTVGRERSSSEERHPVLHVTWNDAVAYCKWLSSKTRKTYRLPTEAEWEYAARGGKNSEGYVYAGNTNAESVGWIGSNSGNKTHEVGGKQANELGLYDMSGNVWEWCSDWYGDYSSSASSNPTGPSSGTNRVLRGGSWRYNAQNSRLALRFYSTPDDRISDRGFRLVLVP